MAWRTNPDFRVSVGLGGSKRMRMGYVPTLRGLEISRNGHVPSVLSDFLPSGPDPKSCII